MFDKALPNWVKVDEERFNKIKNEIEQAENKNLQARPNRGSPMSLNESRRLIQDIEDGKTTSVVVLIQLFVRRHLTRTKLKC